MFVWLTCACVRTPALFQVCDDSQSSPSVEPSICEDSERLPAVTYSWLDLSELTAHSKQPPPPWQAFQKYDVYPAAFPPPLWL